MSISSYDKGKKRLAEVARDAAKKPWILSGWEKGFLATLQRMVERGQSTLDLSAPQMESFEKLENKIYS